MDPLSVLREYTMRNELDRVTIVGDDCCFGNEYRFPRAVETAYRRRGGDRYNLESLLLFVQCKAVKHTEYMQRARAQTLQIVTFTDRKPLLVCPPRPSLLSLAVSTHLEFSHFLPTTAGIRPIKDRSTACLRLSSTFPLTPTLHLPPLPLSALPLSPSPLLSPVPGVSGFESTQEFSPFPLSALPLSRFPPSPPCQEYLEGHLQTTDAIDLIAPIGLPPSAPPSAAPPASIPSSGAATPSAPGALGQGAHGFTSAAVDGATGPGGLGAAEAGDQARKRSRWDTDKRASGAGGEAGAAGADGGGAGGYDVYGKRQRGEGSQAGLGTGRGMAYHSEAVPGMAAAGVTVGGVGLGGGGMSEEEEREAIRELIKRERPVRDRETVLLCPRKKDAFASVLAMLNRREHERKKLDVAHREASKRGHPPAPSSSARPSRDARGGGAGANGGAGGGGGGGGGRQDERQVWRDYMGTDALEELGINPTQSSYVQPGRGGGSGAAGSGAAAAGGSGSGALVVAPQGKPEGQHGRSQPSNLPPSSRHARPQGNPAHQSQHRQHSSSGSSGIGSAAAAAGGSLVPIILVPSAAQTLINIFNVKEFLEDGAYVPAEEKAKAAGGKRAEMVAVQRRMGRDKAVVYHDWDRVAAVFVLGKEWQFKGWPFKDHVDILSKVMGVFVRFEDDSVESAATVKNWNCSILAISKYKRHQDRTAALTFWDRLDKFLAARNSVLTY
ncbi:unnamed protein product [Closterium sp. Naga37s-1]|nr:unnamed protein product [Closterium sp. Naga37s-1]